MSKKKYNVRLLGKAEQDIHEITAYISKDNPSAAINLVDKIDNRLDKLSENPELGKIPFDKDIKKYGYRYLVIDSYLIFYSIESYTIWVHRILHGARDYKNLL